MLHDVLVVLWFFLPIGAANAAPVPAAKLPWLRNINAPMDMGRTFRGRPVLGPHKTWRGLVCGIVVATVVVWVQKYLVEHYAVLAELTNGMGYETLPVFIIGPLFAIGALGGDALKSFFKRRRNIPPGHSWFPFDQLDIFLGAVAVMPFIVLSFMQYVWLALVCLVAQLVFSYLGYLIKFKERPI